jgi:hypothetical protein
MAMHENRLTYETIKSWAMEAYFDFCRDRGVANGRPHAEILGGVSNEFDGCFDRLIEQLMFEVVCMVLNGGWYEQPMAYHREKIQKVLRENGLEGLLAEVPKDEADMFRHDLLILGLI